MISGQAENLSALTAEAPPRSFAEAASPFGALRISITSGKGGVGKSQIAANLALAFVARGRRVLLVDADLGLASLDLVLGVKAERHLLEVVRGTASPHEITIECADNLTLLPAAPGRYDMANLGTLERARLRETLETLGRDTDVVLLDGGAGLSAATVELAGHADETLVVVTPEPTSIRDAYATIKVLSQRTGLRRAWLVPNQVSSVKQAEHVVSSVRGLAKKFLDLDVRVLGSVPRDPQVRDALARGKPFFTKAPSCPAALAIGKLAETLENEHSRTEC